MGTKPSSDKVYTFLLRLLSDRLTSVNRPFGWLSRFVHEYGSIRKFMFGVRNLRCEHANDTCFRGMRGWFMGYYVRMLQKLCIRCCECGRKLYEIQEE